MPATTGRQRLPGATSFVAAILSAMPRTPARLLLATAALAVVACSDSPPAGRAPDGATLAPVGDGQTARIGSAVAVPPAVVVLDGNGEPARGVAVTFTVTAGDGRVEQGATFTDSTGTASALSWVLGDRPGANELTVTAGRGSDAVTTTIAATARPPRWTILVYLAADTPLSIAGLADLDELESVPANPEVQVVVQGEFSPEQFRLAGLTPSQVSLAGFETFRYLAQRGRTPRPGPDGPVITIGNQDLTDPAQLRAFIDWGRFTYPAERTALVLWNRGGGADGVAADVTSAGGRTMSLAGLRSALQGIPPLELLDFDMALVGGYETLETVKDAARVVTFSQGEVSPQGNPYGLFLAGLSAQPTMDGRAFGALVVDRFAAAHLLARTSSTKSAYDMAGYAPFAQALGTLASTLQTDLGTLGADLAASIDVAQRFGVPGSTDLVSLLDSLRAHTSGMALHEAIAAARRTALAPEFRIAASARTGTGSDARDVTRATGLNVVLPSGSEDDRLPATGPRSFATYRQLHPGRPWTALLASWTATVPSRPMVDQGDRSRFELYLTWNVPELFEPADIDIGVIEPSGELYIPFLGTVTPNGQLTADVSGVQKGYEGYLSNRFVEPGPYYFFAFLWSDPSRARPAVQVQYRADQRAPFSLIFASPLPRLSRDVSWQDDPTFSWDEVLAGRYSDLAYLTTIDIVGGTTGGSAVAAASAAEPGTARATGAAPPRLTDAQLRTLREVARRRREAGERP